MFWSYRSLSPPGNSNPFCGGSMNNFWNCTLHYKKYISRQVQTVSKAIPKTTEKDGKLVKTGETVSLNKMVVLKVPFH